MLISVGFHNSYRLKKWHSSENHFCWNEDIVVEEHGFFPPAVLLISSGKKARKITRLISLCRKLKLSGLNNTYSIKSVFLHSLAERFH